MDILDGTPLLDIMPDGPDLNACDGVRTGWLTEVRKSVRKSEADERIG